MKRRGQIGQFVEAISEIRNDFEMARETRFKSKLRGVSSAGSSADYHYRNEHAYLRMIERARYYERNNVIISAALDRLEWNVLQNGMTVDPQTGDEKLDDDLRARFEEWAIDPVACSVDAEHDLNSLASVALRSHLRDGDIAFNPLMDGQLQGIEGHRIRTPSGTKRNVVNGVLMSPRRKRLEYWVTKDDIDPTQALRLVSDVRRYQAWDSDGYRNIFHVYRPTRLSQTRGVTSFAPISDQIGMHDDIQFARLVQQQVVSCFAIIRTRDNGTTWGPGQPKGAQATETQADGSTRTIEGIAPGLEITGAPGERLEGFSPNVPNPSFFEHATLILTFISINLGLPLALLLLDPSKTNFSGWRGSMDEARKGFRRLQNLLVARFYRPVYEWKIRQFLADAPDLRRAAERKEVRILRHNWNPPQWSYIEPVKDATGDMLRQNQGLASPRRIHRERGQDFQEIARETIQDRAFKIRLAIEETKAINETYPDNSDPVTWRELYGEAPLEKVSLTVGSDGEGKQEETKDA